MKDVILIAESCIRNKKGYMDLTAETIGDEFVISTEDHDGYEWKAKCSVDEVFSNLVKSMGLDKVNEILRKIK